MARLQTFHLQAILIILSRRGQVAHLSHMGSITGRIDAREARKCWHRSPVLMAEYRCGGISNAEVGGDKIGAVVIRARPRVGSHGTFGLVAHRG